jgi:hypothetical protein
MFYFDYMTTSYDTSLVTRTKFATASLHLTPKSTGGPKLPVSMAVFPVVSLTSKLVIVDRPQTSWKTANAASSPVPNDNVRMALCKTRDPGMRLVSQTKAVALSRLRNRRLIGRESTKLNRAWKTYRVPDETGLDT